MSDFTDEATYRLYSAGWALVKRLPERTARRLFDRIADRMWRKRGKSVQQLERNIARILGAEATEERVREISRGSLRSYLRYWCEVFRLETWTPERRGTAFQPVNPDYVHDLLTGDRGLVLALPHMGNWDSAGAWLTTQVPVFTTVAERLKPEKLYQRFFDFRESLGFEVLALTGGSRTLLQLGKRLRSGGVVCLVADRDLTATGIPVDFFGEPATFPSGSASLALSTGAALIPVTMWFDGDVQRALFHPAIEPPAEGTREQKVTAMTQALADTFASGIAEHPSDWHMLQPFWRADVQARQNAHSAPGSTSASSATFAPPASSASSIPPPSSASSAPPSAASCSADAPASSPPIPAAPTREPA